MRADLPERAVIETLRPVTEVRSEDGTVKSLLALSSGEHIETVLIPDFNSDGKGEFLIGNICIGTDTDGQGKILWRMPVSASSWPAIADLNGDGLGEIIIPGSDGLVRVLTANTTGGS